MYEDGDGMDDVLMNNESTDTVDNLAFNGGTEPRPSRQLPRFSIEVDATGNKVFTPLSSSNPFAARALPHEDSNSSVRSATSPRRDFQQSIKKLVTRKSTLPKASVFEETRMGEVELELAVTHLKDAYYGRMPIEQRESSYIQRYNRYYSTKLSWVQMVVFIVFLGLIIFEKPATVPLLHEYDYWILLPIEALCVAFFVWRTYNYYKLTPKELFWKEGKAIGLVVINVITILDIVYHIIHYATAPHVEVARWSRVIRPLYVINLTVSRALRQAFRSVRKTLWAISHVMTLLFISMFLFSILFKELFERVDLIDHAGEAYFDSYEDSIWNLYVCLSTANFPDVMMPGWYEFGAEVPMLFILFLLITKYVLEGILLAVVYHNYSLYMQKDTRQMMSNRKKNLRLCFAKLAKESGTSTASNGHATSSNALHTPPTITFVEWSLLLEQFGGEGMTNGRMWLLWCALDAENKQSITAEQFEMTVSVLMCGYNSISSNENIFTRRAPKIYNSSVSVKIRNMVKHKAFDWLFNSLILITIILMIADVEHILVDTTFVALFTLEIMLKVYALGFRNFIRSGWNLYDTFCVVGALIGLVLSTHGSTKATFAVDLLITLRVFRLTRVISRFPRFGMIIDTIAQIMPAISSYGTMIILVFYSFSVVGMWAYSGLITTDGEFTNYTGSVYQVGSPYYLGLHRENPKLEGSEFAGGGYYNNNFNNYQHATITLFEMMVVNQWHVIVEGISLVSEQRTLTRFFFIVFHLFVVVVMVNIFMAFILEAFLHVMIAEEEERKGRSFDSVEDKLQKIMKEEIANDPVLKKEFEHIEIKRSRRLVVLVERMFATESTV